MIGQNWTDCGKSCTLDREEIQWVVVLFSISIIFGTVAMSAEDHARVMCSIPGIKCDVMMSAPRSVIISLDIGARLDRLEKPRTQEKRGIKICLPPNKKYGAKTGQS